MIDHHDITLCTGSVVWDSLTDLKIYSPSFPLPPFQNFFSSSSDSAGSGIDGLPSWVKCLFASSCFVNSFAIQKAAIATTLDLINLTQTVVSQQVSTVFSSKRNANVFHCGIYASCSVGINRTCPGFKKGWTHLDQMEFDAGGTFFLWLNQFDRWIKSELISSSLVYLHLILALYLTYIFFASCKLCFALSFRGVMWYLLRQIWAVWTQKRWSIIIKACAHEKEALEKKILWNAVEF